uniref:Uncharacterized protein n=1 Tax=Dicentrarchus labrax TaxID=13489 RepID=A0A8C4F935_DICLA
MWFQQLTHSVRSATHGRCPCMVRIPSPSTGPSILETIPEQLFAKCQYTALSWLKYQQESALTLLKHDMALDYILAKQGGLCVALNLTRDACYTLIPDSSDNITSVIDALRNIRDVHWKVRWVDQPDFRHCFDFIP